MDSLTDTIDAIVRFRDERDWAQYHTPRHLAAALAIEAAELQEILLWKTDAETEGLLAGSPTRGHLAEELADVLIFALLLAHRLKLDPLDAIRVKLQKNAEKYPVTHAKGNARKYTEFGGGDA